MFRGDAEEFRLRNLEGEFLMAFSANIASRFAAYRDYTWRGVVRRALRASRYECAGDRLAMRKRGSEGTYLGSMSTGTQPSRSRNPARTALACTRSRL